MMRRCGLVVMGACLSWACGGEPAASDPGGGGAAEGGGVAAGAGAATGGSPGSGGSTASGGGGGGAPPGKVPMFVAQGSVGRTMISCDDGQSWVADHAWDTDGDPMVCGSTEPARCYETTCTYQVGGECVEQPCCDHSADVAKGVVNGDGQFVATWGWGMPGEVRTSGDGVDWTPTLPNDTFGGIAYGGGRFVVASRTPHWSEDGVTWHEGGEADFRNSDGSIMWSVRRFAYADYQGGGRFVAVASGNGSRDMLVSSDGGASWWRPSVIPDDCAGEVGTYGGIVSGNDVIVIVDMSGNACRSTDGGETWSVTSTGVSQVLSHGVWTGSAFAFWGDDSVMVTSPDGQSWTQTPMTTPLRLGPVARSADGTYVGFGSVWDGYENQSLYRSTDGLAWEPLGAPAFEQGHPIFYVTFGYGDPSSACPAE